MEIRYPLFHREILYSKLFSFQRDFLFGCPRSHDERYVYALASLDTDLLARSGLLESGGEVQCGRIYAAGVVVSAAPDGSRVEAASL